MWQRKGDFMENFENLTDQEIVRRQKVEKLKELGVNVFSEEIFPWRFDVARNVSLKLVPNDTDICVCTDLDEVFVNGWRKKLEEI